METPDNSAQGTEPELTSEDVQCIAAAVDKLPHLKRMERACYIQGAEDATLRKYAELTALRSDLAAMTAGLPTTNASDVKFMVEQNDLIIELRSQVDRLKEGIAYIIESNKENYHGDYFESIITNHCRKLLADKQ
jgi:hypothetical protein